MILGIDTSTYLEELSLGAQYFKDGKRVDPLDVFVQNGVSYMRIRLWNDPKSPDGKPYLAGNCDYDNFIRLSRLAIGKGYKILLDLHYSDFWADPGKQFIPKAWQGFDLDGLEKAVYDYTVGVLKDARRDGVVPSLIQVGNEITNGMLWPLGRLYEAEGGGQRTNYPAFIRLLKAGLKGAREACPEAKLIVHLEKSYDTAIYMEYFTKLKEAGADYDIIGMSYYPYWHGNFSQLFANVEACKVFGKEIMIMELGYAFTLENYILTENGATDHKLVVGETNVSDFNITVDYPLTAKGQRDFVRDFLKMARERGIAGVFYWEPLWIPGEGVCWASAEGQKYIREEGKPTANEWANQCLYDYEGKALPALDEFRL